MFTVAGDPAAGNEHVDMRVKTQVTVPRMQDRQKTRQRSQMTFLRTEFSDGLSGDTHQQAVHELLMAPERVSQF